MSTSDVKTHNKPTRDELLNQFLNAATRDTKSNKLPKLPELCEALLDAFGGVKSLAKKIEETFDKANPQQRGRIAEAVLRLLERNADKGGAGSDATDMSAFTDEEINREMAKWAKEHLTGA